MTSDKPLVYMDGAFVPWEKATIHVSTHAFLYGTGVFEGVRAYWDETAGTLNVWALPQHMDRLERNWRMMGFEEGPSSKDLQKACVELLSRNGYQEDVYIRPIVYLGEETAKVRPTKLKGNTILFTFPLKNYFGRDSLRVMVSSWLRPGSSVIPPNGKVNGAYANSYLSTVEAQRAGYDESIMLNDRGYVSEAPGANLFLVQKGQLVTPPVSADILDGVTRMAMFRIAADLDIPVVERDINRVELYGADEMFLCGTAVEVLPITEIEGRAVGDGKMGPVAHRIQETFKEVVRGQNPRFKDLLTPVPPANKVAVAKK